MDSLKASDATAAAVAVAQRVTLADIEGAIAHRYDTTGERAAQNAVDGVWPVDQLRILSICLLVMKNGFTVIGHSAPASPENFNADFGRDLAYQSAIRQLWPLMGFALRDKLALAGQ